MALSQAASRVADARVDSFHPRTHNRCRHILQPRDRDLCRGSRSSPRFSFAPEVRRAEDLLEAGKHKPQVGTEP